MIKNGKYIAVRPESLIEARYDLTASQNDILDIVLSKLDNDDNYEYELTVNDYKHLYRTDTSNIYRDLKKAVKQFEHERNGFYLIDSKSKREIFFAWFASIDYSDNEGKIILEVGKKLKSLLLEMKKRIYYKIEYPLNFSSVYSKRIYYYLKSFEDTGWRQDSLDTLRKKLYCPESYSKYSFFKLKVLNIAYKEINNNSDISFEFEEIKTGRKVTALKFYINSNKVEHKKEPIKAAEEGESFMNLLNYAEDVSQEEAYFIPGFKDACVPPLTDLVVNEKNPLDPSDYIDDIKAILIKHKIDDATAMKIYLNAGGNLNHIKNVYDMALNSKTKINNVIGFMVKMVKPNAINESQQFVKSNKFLNFPQTKYDFDEIEKNNLQNQTEEMRKMKEEASAAGMSVDDYIRSGFTAINKNLKD